jgi:hypothetical protein
MKIIATYTKTIIEEKEIEIDNKFQKLSGLNCLNLPYKELVDLKNDLEKVLENSITEEDYYDLKEVRNSENDEMLWEW